MSEMFERGKLWEQDAKHLEVEETLEYFNSINDGIMEEYTPKSRVKSARWRKPL
jgi:hypothetical protein